MKKYTLFIGYDIPLALDIKHRYVMDILDEFFTRIEIQGDIVHVIPIEQKEKAITIIEFFNKLYDVNMTCDLEEYE